MTSVPYEGADAEGLTYFDTEDDGTRLLKSIKKHGAVTLTTGFYMDQSLLKFGRDHKFRVIRRKPKRKSIFTKYVLVDRERPRSKRSFLIPCKTRAQLAKRAKIIHNYAYGNYQPPEVLAMVFTNVHEKLYGSKGI